MQACPKCGYVDPATVRGTSEWRTALSDRRRDYWDALLAKTAEIRARGVKIDLDELTSHRKRQPITRLFHLYNAFRGESGLKPLNFLDFDPWETHLQAQGFVFEAFSSNARDIEAAERLFGFVLGQLSPVVAPETV
jgi:hypothetical protein